MTQYSFDTLTDSAEQLAEEFYETAQTDTTILSAMAALISEQTLTDEDTLLDIMNSFNLERSFISYINLLFPDGQLINQKGEKKDASKVLNFEEEKKKGSYISDRQQGIWDPSNLVVRNCVPVVKNGETIAMLYGVFSLIDASEKNNFDFYDGHSFIMLIDGTNTDILLDTWHNTLGNLSSLGGRKILFGDTFSESLENMKEGLSGDVSFISQSTGQTFYMHYTPVGINNWNLVLGVAEEAALAGTRTCIQSLYLMALIIAVTLVLYLILVIWYLSSANQSIYQLSITDQLTQCLNRSAYEKYLKDNQKRLFKEAACIYIDVNGLHELNNRLGHPAGDQMLQAVAASLKHYFPSSDIYRIGGDEFVLFPDIKAQTTCEATMLEVLTSLDAQGYSISYGISSEKDICGLDLLIEKADEKMLANKKAYYAQHQRCAR